MQLQSRKLYAAILTLAILASVAALPFHLLADHSDEAERGVCGVCIALSLSLGPADSGLVSHDNPAVATGAAIAGDGHVQTSVITLEAPRGPPSLFA